MTTERFHLSGYLLVAGAAVCWAFGASLATHATVTSTLEPVLAALFAFLIVGERLAAPQVAGMAAVIAAIVLLSHGQAAD